MPSTAAAGMTDVKAILDGICQETRRACTRAFGSALSALVVTGSVARAEASITVEDGRAAILGDAEFLLVFGKMATVPAAETLNRLERAIESALDRAGIACSIDLDAVTDRYLRRLGPHIFAYELSAFGRVLVGSPDILSLVPPFSADEIPWEDAWRLLCNRMIESLDALVSTGPEGAVAADYSKVKLYLDMATSYLLFVGAYEPTYRGRADRLQELASHATAVESPVDLQAFAHRVEQCTRTKLAVNGLTANAGITGVPGGPSWSDAVADAQALWRWELARLLDTPRTLLNADLLSRWQRRQPLAQRLRGWLYVVRAEGWHRSCRSWGRWLRLAMGSTPRYRVYEVGCQLFFETPRLLGLSSAVRAGDGAEVVRRLGSRLPMRGIVEQGDGWRRLAHDVVGNYRTFLVGTRA